MIAPASQLTADYSYISATANCARFSYYAFERNLAPIGPPPLALHMGTALHVGLDWLYTHDWDIEGAIAAALVAWGDYELPATHKHAYATRGHLEIILRNYANDRRDDPIAPIRLRASDLDPERAAANQFSIDDDGFVKLVESPLSTTFGNGIHYAGKIDNPALVNGEYALIDNKSSRAWLSEYWVQKYAYSHQFRGYLAILRELTGLPFDRVYINGIYTGKEAADDLPKWEKRSTRRSALFGPFIYSDGMLEETREWARTWLALAQQFRQTAAEREAQGESGEGAWPQNDKACFLYGDPCVYYTLCKRSPHLREAQIRSLYQIREFTGMLASGADSDDG